MRSIASVARWATYLLVAVTVLVVIVACPEGPTGGPGQPGQPGQPGVPGGVSPIGIGSIDAVAVQAGTTTTMDVAKYFNEPQGEALTYAASSGAPAVATASNAASVVSITGVAAGTATISVTATDPTGLSAKQTLEVTVTAGPATPAALTCGTGTLDVGKTCDATIKESEILESADAQMVTVAPKGDSKTVWVVTAKKKGSTIVRVLNKADGAVVSTFTIKVNNRAPKLTEKAQRPQSELALITMSAWELHKDSLKRARRAYLIEVDVKGYITDPDGDVLTWTAETSTPHVIVLARLDGTAGKPHGFVVDVTAAARDFNLMVYATDDDKAKSPTATIGVRGAKPRIWTYQIEQFDDGTFLPETIGMRKDVDHMMQFVPVSLPDGPDDDDYALEFIQDWAAAWKPSAKTDLAQNHVDDLMNPDTVKPATPTLGAGYLVVTKTGPVIITADRSADDDPSPYELYDVATTSAGPVLNFSLTGGTGVATITITLNVWYDADITPGVGGDGIVSAWHEVDSEKLTLDIVRVTK